MSTTTLIETFRPGYPRFSALIGADRSFHICRRFARTRMRLLIHAQDKITILEAELDRIDEDESNALFLASTRRDSNTDRSRVLRDLESALEAYDGLLDRNSKALSFPKATHRDVESLQRWVDGTACLARSETQFLEHEDDLINLVGPFDNAFAQVEPLIENILVFLVNRLHLTLPRRFSSDDHVFFFHAAHLRVATQVVICMISVTLLWVPAFILGDIHSRAGLSMGIFCAAGTFTLVMSIFSKAKTVEIFVAGAGYAAVLVVFISGYSISAAG